MEVYLSKPSSRDDLIGVLTTALRREAKVTFGDVAWVATKTGVELVSAALAEEINTPTEATNRIPFVNWPIVTMI